MKTTNAGFVYRKGKKYLRMHKRTTHTGHHETFEWVKDLQRATVFYYPPRVEQGILANTHKIRAIESHQIILLPDVIHDNQ